MTYPPGYNCCCTCYYLKPAVCCDGEPGPVRYRVRGEHAFLAAAAAGADPVFIVLRPDGFALGSGGGDGDYTTTGGGANIELEDTVEAECWVVTSSTVCDDGELIDWVEFDGTPIDSPSQGEYSKGNIEEATVLIDDEFFPDPEECEQGNLNNCPVKCDGVCYSVTATAEFRLQCTLVLDDDTTVAIDVTDSGRMFDDDCAPRAFGAAITENTGLSMFGCNDAFSYKDVALPGPTRNVGINFASDNSYTITDSLYDSGAGRTVASVTDIIITRTRDSAVAWTTDGEGDCVVEEAP